MDDDRDDRDDRTDADRAAVRLGYGNWADDGTDDDCDRPRPTSACYKCGGSGNARRHAFDWSDSPCTACDGTGRE